ncbi:MAG: hypothetical protein H8E32_13860 [Nitrospinae bacterium]|nr:hypothetical protein [Nitrospinota bacterium]
MTNPKNRFGTPKTDKTSVKDRFSPENQKRMTHIVEEKKENQKKKGYKGKRKSLTLRLPVKLIDDLAFVCFVSRKAKVDICETSIAETVKEQFKALEKGHGKEGLEAFQKVFKVQS